MSKQIPTFFRVGDRVVFGGDRPGFVQAVHKTALIVLLDKERPSDWGTARYIHLKDSACLAFAEPLVALARAFRHV